MSRRRFTTTIGGMLLGALAFLGVQKANETGLLGDTEISLTRLVGCRARHPEAFERAAPRRLFLSTSRSWYALYDEGPEMPFCSRAELPLDDDDPGPIAVHANVGLRDLSVLYSEVDPLAPELLIVELEMLMLREWTPTLALRRQAAASGILGSLERALGVPHTLEEQGHAIPECPRCFNPAWVGDTARRIARHTRAAESLRPHQRRLIDARIAAKKHTIIIWTPRTPMLMRALDPTISPWREFGKELDESSPYLHYWEFPRLLGADKYRDPSHFNEAGRVEVRAWLVEELRRFAASNLAGSGP
jgi:hypothetical protein